MSNKNNNDKTLNELFSFTKPNLASSWETNMIRWPHGATTNSGTFENNFFNRAKEDEENSKAPERFPYPLDFVVDDMVKTYENLHRLKSNLISTLKYPNLKQSEKNVLKKQIKMLNLMIEKIKEMSTQIEKIRL